MVAAQATNVAQEKVLFTSSTPCHCSGLAATSGATSVKRHPANGKLMACHSKIGRYFAEKCRAGKDQFEKNRQMVQISGFQRVRSRPRGSIPIARKRWFVELHLKFGSHRGAVRPGDYRAAASRWLREIVMSSLIHHETNPCLRCL
jgi:hypothetical protein